MRTTWLVLLAASTAFLFACARPALSPPRHAVPDIDAPSSAPAMPGDYTAGDLEENTLLRELVRRQETIIRQQDELIAMMSKRIEELERRIGGAP